MHRLFDHDHNVTISADSIVFAVLFILGLFLLYFVREIVLTIFLAVILMSALNPAVKWLERKLKFPRVLAIFVMYIAIILVLAFALSVIVPPLLSEAPNLISSLHLPPLFASIPHIQLTFSEASAFFNQVRSSFGEIYSIISSTFSTVLAFFTILVMTFYMLIERDELHKKVSWFSKEPRHLQLVKEFVDAIEVQLGGWVRGQFFLMATIGVLIYIGLFLFGVPYALPLALAAAMLEILPNLGPTLAAIPGIIVTYSHFGWAMAGFVTLFYIIVQQLENHFIVPRIMKANVDVNPLTTIVTILTGLKLGGIMGAFLAVPVYITLRSAYSLWLREKKL